MAIYLIYCGGGYDLVGFKSSLSEAIDFVRRSLKENEYPSSKNELLSLEEFNMKYLKTKKEEDYWGDEWAIQKMIELKDLI